MMKRAVGATLMCLTFACLAGAMQIVRAQDAVSRDSLIAAARDIIQATRYCALVTIDESGHPQTRTMEPFPPDEDFVIWMGTNRNTAKVREIQNNPRVNVYYQRAEVGGYVSISGTARLVDDSDEKERHWNESWERFYPNRERDYILIAVTPERMEVLDYARGVVGDANTWAPPAVDFSKGGSEH